MVGLARGTDYFAGRTARRLATGALAAQLALTLAGCYSSPRASAPNPAPPPAAEPASAAAPAPQPAGIVAVTAVQAAGLPAAVALDQARVRLLDGNYPRALDDFASIQQSYPGTAEAAEAALRYGEAALADDRFATAEDALRRFLARYPDRPDRGVALLLLGRALEGKGDGGAAVAAYNQYLAIADPTASASDVLHLRAANVYFGAGRIADGWAELSQAVTDADQSGSASARARAYEALGARYVEAGSRAQAADAWQVALDSMVAAHRPAKDVAVFAWRLVGAYQNAGRRDQANALRARIVDQWPRTFTAQQAMTDLGPESVPPLQRGIIWFSNRKWRQAVDAFETYLANGAPEGRAGEVRFDRAVALARLNDDDALAALDDVASRYPDSPWAPQALWEAGNLLRRQGNLPAAAARLERLAVGYPNDEQRGQALYWLGKLLPGLGNVAGGQRYMEAAAAAGYEDFYTFRARSALKRPAFAAKSLADQEQISQQERDAWVQWLATHGRSPDAQADRRAQLEQDPRFRRGVTLLDAGFRKEAEEELREVLEAFDNDVVAVEDVALQARDRGFYPLSVTLGHRLFASLNAMGETSLLTAPRVVQKLILPLAFLDLVEPAAKANSVDPLLLLGLIKQESWFEPRAASGANARGLTQFIPETAKTVADELSWPNWTWDDMNRPYVSVPFGAHYISGLIKDFRGNYYFALAGYNGGPGNVLRWAKGDWNRDPDLFVEDIGYVETRSYVKAVAGNYELYKAIYYK